MAGSFPTDTNSHIARQVKSTIAGTHPEYSYWADGWETIRDCVLGEYQIKQKSGRYLPKLAGHSEDEYAAFLGRAYYYNMTARTVNGLVGTVFRKEPKIKGIDKALEKNLKEITKTNSSAVLFAKEIVTEVLTVGRYGVLVDMDRGGNRPPFLVGYAAENIVDWTVEDIDGRFVLTEVVLREIVPEKTTTMASGMAVTSTAYRANYRILALEEGIYVQYVFENQESVPMKTRELGERIVPVSFGVPFKFIPFMFFGPMSNGAGVEKSPILDIALMNISHYHTSAILEHGRFFTAMPVYHINISNPEESKGSYVVGPSVVWEWEGEKQPGIIEYHGHGLGALERALDMKEAHVSALGGRMLGTRSSAVAESDNLVKLKEKNEQSLLLNVTTTVNIGFSKVLEWWSNWQSKSSGEIEVELNQDFLFDALSAREFRAFAMMYKEGLLSIEIMYDIMRKAEIVPEYMDLEEFKAQVTDPKNFPNNPDIVPKQQGFPDAAAKLKLEQDKRVLSQEMEIAEMTSEATVAAAKAQPKVKPDAKITQ